MDLIVKRPFTSKTTTSLDMWLKQYTNIVHNPSDGLLVDRISCLPDELLIHILSLLPAKDAVVACFSCKRMLRIFPWITSLVFDDFSTPLCFSIPTIDRYPIYSEFVTTVIQAHRSQYLTRFKLHLSKDSKLACLCRRRYMRRNYICYPDLKSTQINAWITYPLNCIGLRELDLYICTREKTQLPAAIFMCETLEVLKIDVNLGLDQAYIMPSFRLPNLKLLHLCVSFISEDDFVPRLVASCPVLEDLTVVAIYDHIHIANISSPSLRRLDLHIYHTDTYLYDNSDIVLIHTPNLEYWNYFDNLALSYSIPKMGSLAEASINLGNNLLDESKEESVQQIINLIRPMSNVQKLALSGSLVEGLSVVELKDQLPAFRSLNHLELSQYYLTCWDKLLLSFLNRSPVLETLVFPQGLIESPSFEIQDNAFYITRELLNLEREFCKTTLSIIPWCCRFNLKKIVVKRLFGVEREIYLIQFLLRHALVLEELVIFRAASQHLNGDQTTLESTLQNLPRASITCSIQVITSPRC